jgi:hypothetical protein
MDFTLLARFAAIFLVTSSSSQRFEKPVVSVSPKTEKTGGFSNLAE